MWLYLYYNIKYGCDIMVSNERRMNFYNYGQPIDLSMIPEGELEHALEDFSEGSIELKECLNVLWSNSMPTISCCRGNHIEILDGEPKLHIVHVGYISFARDVDVFSYLSSKFINNSSVSLRQKNGKQTISFYGKNKSQLFVQLANDVLSGRKENNEELSKKINIRVPITTYVNSMGDLLEEHGINDDIIMAVKQLYAKAIKLNYDFSAMKNDTKEYELAIEERNKILSQMYSVLEPVVSVNNFAAHKRKF